MGRWNARLLLHVHALLVGHVDGGLLLGQCGVLLLRLTSRLACTRCACARLLKSLAGGKVGVSERFIGTNSLRRIKFEQLLQQINCCKEMVQMSGKALLCRCSHLQQLTEWVCLGVQVLKRHLWHARKLTRLNLGLNCFPSARRSARCRLHSHSLNPS